jgi:NAD(P) transhydrogenase subunit alpha
MVESMQDGSVIVDLAAEQGGNCALTEPGKVVVKHGVTLIGYTDLPSRLATQSSQLYGTNLRHLLSDMCPEKNGQIVVDMEDDVVRGATVIKDGEITWPPPRPKTPPPAPPQHAATAAPPQVEAGSEEKKAGWGPVIFMAVAAVALVGLGNVAPPDFLGHLTVFLLSCFIGYMVIWNVTPALHTPLMSETNAISGIIVIGALLEIGGPLDSIVTILALIGVFIATINVFGGFLVTQRMLRMFQK